jgi:pilus assembly protein Flp/PilA
VIETPEGRTTMFDTKNLTIAGFVMTVSRFRRDACGTTAVEYAIIASGIAVVIAASVAGIGSGVKGMFTSVSTALK